MDEEKKKFPLDVIQLGILAFTVIAAIIAAMGLFWLIITTNAPEALKYSAFTFLVLLITMVLMVAFIIMYVELRVRMK